MGMLSTIFKVGFAALYLQRVAGGTVDNILEDHNAYRCMHNADALTYNAELEAAAQVWADELATTMCGGLEHDPTLQAIGQGENLFLCSWIVTDAADCASGTAATRKWYEEVQFYMDGPSGGTNTPGKAVGHFTQVVWKDTQEVGCASSSCETEFTGDDDFFKDYKVQNTIVACRYGPPGNYLTQYQSNVEPEAIETEEVCREGGGGTPDTPAPVTPAPVTPAPITPAPVTPAPVTPSPTDAVTPAPVTLAPVTPAPVTPAPVTPSPMDAVTPAPVTPAPVTLSPTDALTPAPVPVVTPAPSDGPTCFGLGIPGIEGSNRNGDVCCPLGCTQCGGRGCGRNGRVNGYDRTDCCTNYVLRDEEYCSEKMEAPCTMDEPSTPAPTPAPTVEEGPTCFDLGIPGIEGSNRNGDVCCPLGCTQCGGRGCGRNGRINGYDRTDCCTNYVLRDEEYCSEKMEAPCTYDPLNNNNFEA